MAGSLRTVAFPPLARQAARTRRSAPCRRSTSWSSTASTSSTRSGPYEVFAQRAASTPRSSPSTAPATVTASHGLRLDAARRARRRRRPRRSSPAAAGTTATSRGRPRRGRARRPARARCASCTTPATRDRVSVCTGAMLLAAAGITDGRPATTHHGAIEDLRASGARRRGRARVVDDGDLITAGGVTSGIDLALHLVERECGRAAGRRGSRGRWSIDRDRPGTPIRMADKKLQGKKIAILATDGVEQVELIEPRKALEEAGAETDLVSLEEGQIQGFDHLDHGDKLDVDKIVKDVERRRLRRRAHPRRRRQRRLPARRRGRVHVRRRVRRAEEADRLDLPRPVDPRRDRHRQGPHVTSWPSLKTDIENAGGTWVDEEVHVDSGLTTSRKPDDLPAFNAKMIEEFCEGEHDDAPAARGPLRDIQLQPLRGDDITVASPARARPRSSRASASRSRHRFRRGPDQSPTTTEPRTPGASVGSMRTVTRSGADRAPAGTGTATARRCPLAIDALRLAMRAPLSAVTRTSTVHARSRTRGHGTRRPDVPVAQPRAGEVRLDALPVLGQAQDADAPSLAVCGHRLLRTISRGRTVSRPSPQRVATRGAPPRSTSSPGPPTSRAKLPRTSSSPGPPSSSRAPNPVRRSPPPRPAGRRRAS